MSDLSIKENLPTQSIGVMSAVNLILDASNFDAIEKLAHLMASGVSTVPNHLKGNPADCFAIIMQSLQWGMNPFAVAPKTFNANGIISYEAQLVNAVITSMAPTKDRLHYEWFGPWENVIGKFTTKTNAQNKTYITPAWTLDDEKGCGVRVWATIKGESEPRVLEILLSQARNRFSTLWAEDPRQQLAYLASKRWSRLHCPDVIMGVYTVDELDNNFAPAREINPEYQEKAAQEEAQKPPTDMPETWPAPAFERQFKKWSEAISNGRCTHEDCIAHMTEKLPLSEAQIARIHDIKAPIQGEATHAEV